MPDSSYHVAFSPEMHLEITQESRKRGTSVPQVIRDRLEEWKTLRDFKSDLHLTQQHLRYLEAELDALFFMLEELYTRFAEDEHEQGENAQVVRRLKDSLKQIKSECLSNQTQT